MITARFRSVNPTAPIVTLAELYLHLHLDTEGSPPTHPEDTNLTDYVQAITDELDAGDGWLGRALMPQQWVVFYDGFPCWDVNNRDRVLRIPYPPLITVDEVSYRNSQGDLVTMTEGVDYDVRAGNPVGGIAPRYLKSWPVTADVDDAVQVSFTCGYDPDALPPNPVPSVIKQMVRVAVGTMYNNREENAVNVTVQTLDNFRNAVRTLKVEL